MIVDLFIPCYIDQMYPDVALNMIKILEKIGCAVNYDHEQTCCGKPAFDFGHWDDCKEVGDKFIREFLNDRYIVSPSTSCTGFVKNYYPEMFHNSVLHNEYKQIQKNIYEFSDFLVNILKITSIGASLHGKATYMDTCSGINECQLQREARTLLEKVRGLELVEINNPSICCGFGGPFSVKMENIASSLAEQKAEEIQATGAHFLISNDMSCLMHMDTYFRKKNIPIKVMHLVDVLTSGWD